MVPQQLNGFLLHRREYRETSYLTDFFTAELGKISAVVKGVRGNKGDKKSLLQSFQPLLISISGKHELRNLNQLESSASMFRLAGHHLFSAMYINEILNRLLPKEVPHPELYCLYQETLALLNTGCKIEPCLREFEISLLNELGYGFDLNYDYENEQAVEPDGEYCLVLEQGVKRVGAEFKGNNRFSGDALLQMSQLIWNPASLHCAKSINRLALSQLLGPKPLKSRELFQQTWKIKQKNTV
ncbi:DNA repair protein RecO [Paraglaciecola sp. L3A3]|uniref:DNA repair protein RecO n=1 Tax=Paraglaciecola sp. L3A3 TaxID=2686358 RepID=UPI00131D399D|nr:DNA repair protein RecO [Paraglaciecola sp. L3A3]